MVDANVSDGSQGGGFRGFDLAGLVARNRRHIPLVLIITAVVLAADIAYTFMATPRYTSTATMYYEPQKTDITTTQNNSPMGDQERDQAVDTQVEALKSPALVDTVVTQMHLDQDPKYAVKKSELKLAPDLQRDGVLDRVLKDLKVKRVGQTLLLTVSFTHDSPTKAAAVANAFAQAFLQRQVQQKIEASHADNALLNAQIDDMRQKVEAADKAVQDYKGEHNLVGSDTNGTALTEAEISTLDGQLAMARSAQAQAQGRLEAAQRQLKNGSHGEDVGAALGSPTISELRQQRAQISARVADMKGRYGPLHPDLQTAEHQLTDIDNQIQAEINRIISNLTAEVEVAKQSTASLEASVSSTRGQLISGDAASVKLNELQRNADAARQLYETVLTRVKETSTQQAISQADSRIDTPATPSSQPSQPIVLLNILLGLIVGLGLGILAAFIVERWNVRVTSIDKPKTKQPIDAIMAHPLSGFAEAFRGVATSLTYADASVPMQIIAITSAVPEEGKTTTSICLSRVLAMGGTKVVLVDTDLRRRSINVLFKGEPEFGLIEVLDGKCTLEQALRLDEKSGAWLLPLTRNSHMAKAPFATPAFDKLLADLKGRFGLVILDTPPLLPVVDTRVIAQKVDGLALLVRWRQTPMRAVRAAIHELEGVNAPINGIALTQVNMKSQAYASYGYQAYYHKDFKKYYLE